MTEIIRETINSDAVTSDDSSSVVVATPIETEATNSQTTEYIVYLLLGALEILLTFRLVLKLMGASISSTFVGFIYGLTGLFILPFEGIFRRGFSQGIETTSILEPSTLVAIIVYAILAWGIVKWIRVLSRKQQNS